MTTTSTVATQAPTAERRRRLGHRAQLLAGASVTYNVLEAVVAISAGLVASSVALIGFGLDSTVEVASGLVILWQFRHRLPETRERQALRLIGVSFLALAAWVGFESVRTLLGNHEAEPSLVGVAIAAASVVVMPFLSWAQRRTGRELNSGSVVADSKMTELCAWMSVVLLLGLVLNATLGWSWADPIAGLAIAAVAAVEGVRAWQGETCGCGPVATHDSDTDTDTACSCADGDCTDTCCAPAEEPQAGAVVAPTGTTLLDLVAPERGPR